MWWLQALILGGLYQVDKHPFSTVLLAMVNSSFGFFFQLLSNHTLFIMVF